MAELTGTLSSDSHGRTSDAVAFRNGNILTPITVTSTAQLVPASLWRNSVKLVNTGTDTVYYGFDDTVTSTDGLPIAPNGGDEVIGAGINVEIYVVCAATESSTLKGGELG